MTYKAFYINKYIGDWDNKTIVFTLYKWKEFHVLINITKYSSISKIVPLERKHKGGKNEIHQFHIDIPDNMYRLGVHCIDLDHIVSLYICTCKPFNLEYHCLTVNISKTTKK